MISLPDILTRPTKKQHIYVIIKSPPREPLAWAINHVGIITFVEKSPYGRNEATGSVTVEFWVNKEWRGLTAPIQNFTILEPGKIPPDLKNIVGQKDKDATRAFRAAEKAAARAEKANSRHLNASDARIVRFFQESRNFWKAWKGHGTPPVDPVTGLDATERYHPELEKELYEQALNRHKKPPS